MSRFESTKDGKTVTVERTIGFVVMSSDADFAEWQREHPHFDVHQVRPTSGDLAFIVYGHDRIVDEPPRS